MLDGPAGQSTEFEKPHLSAARLSRDAMNNTNAHCGRTSTTEKDNSNMMDRMNEMDRMDSDRTSLMHEICTCPVHLVLFILPLAFSMRLRVSVPPW
jgi:hypothetical protein